LLGGRSYAEHLVDGSANIFYAGVPQGRCLADSGPRGAQLIHVSEQVECTKLDCSAIRYENINIDAGAINNLDDLELKLCEYAEFYSWKPDRINLVHWDVNCKQSTSAFHDTNTTFMQWQQKFGQQSMSSSSSVYTLSVNVHYGHENAVATDGEDLLSDYLFALASLRENGWSQMTLAGTEELEEATNDWVRVAEDLEGLRTLDDAAQLGELLLGGYANPLPNPPTDSNIEPEAA